MEIKVSLFTIYMLGFLVIAFKKMWNFDFEFPHGFIAYVILAAAFYHWHFIFLAAITPFIVEKFRRRKIPKGTATPPIWRFVTSEFIDGDNVTLTFDQFLNYYNLAPSKYTLYEATAMEYVTYYKGSCADTNIYFQTSYDLRAFRKWRCTKKMEKQNKLRNEVYKDYLEHVQKDIDRYRENYINAD